MRQFLLAIAAAVSLTACTPGSFGLASSPAAVAPENTLDERLGLAVETAYTGAAKSAALAIRTGVVTDPATIRKIGELDKKAKAAVDATRAAYDARNAKSYSEAFTLANGLVKQLLAAF